MLDLDSFPMRGIGAITFTVAPLARVIDAIVAEGQGSKPRAVHFANAFTIALADEDAGYRRVLHGPHSIRLTDGVPVTWVGKRQYPELAQDWTRLYGPDVMTGVFDADDGTLGHYLLGGSPETLAALTDVIGARWPQVRIVGTDSPPFRDPTAEDFASRDTAIRASGARYVWVGLGTPKQDREVARLTGELDVIALAVGAAFDFIAGTKPQAPEWMQRGGLEWAYRLAREPRRLAKRYLWGNPRFLVAAHRNPGLRKRRPAAPESQSQST